MLKASCGDLFVLTAAQLLPVMELKQLLELIELNRKYVTNLEATPHVPTSQLYGELEAFNEAVMQVKQLHLDVIEHFILRAIMLFQPGKFNFSK